MHGASPAPANPLGPVGAYAAHGLLRAWGLAAVLLPAVFLGYAFALFRDYDVSQVGRRLTGAVLLLPALCGLLHLIPVSWGWVQGVLTHWDQLQFRGLGGALGRLVCGPVDPPFLGGLLVRWLDVAGAAAVLAIIAVGGLLLMDFGLSTWFRRTLRSIRSAAEESGSQSSAHRVSTSPFVPSTPPAPKNRHTSSIHGVTDKLKEVSVAPLDQGAEALLERIRQHKRDRKSVV